MFPVLSRHQCIVQKKSAVGSEAIEEPTRAGSLVDGKFMVERGSFTNNHQFTCRQEISASILPPKHYVRLREAQGDFRPLSKVFCPIQTFQTYRGFSE